MSRRHFKASCSISSLGITGDGNKEELVDENCSLEDAELFVPLLKLKEREGNIKEKVLHMYTGMNFVN